MKNIFKTNDLLRLFLGITFLSAGIYRIFNWHQAIIEFSAINLNYSFLIAITIILEIIGGVFLILNIKTKEVLTTFVVFLIIVLTSSLATNGKSLLLEIRELFFLNQTPTDIFLHFTYLIILIYLLGKK